MGINYHPRYNMSISQDVVWQLTKRNNAQLVKFNENMWSRHPLNMTGFHNASQAASTVSVHGARESVQHGATLKKDQKRFQVCMRHGTKKMAANSCSGGERSTLSSGTVHAAHRTIKGLVFQTHSARRNALRRLQRVSNSSRSSVPGAAAAPAKKE